MSINGQEGMDSFFVKNSHQRIHDSHLCDVLRPFEWHKLHREVMPQERVTSILWLFSVLFWLPNEKSHFLASKQLQSHGSMS